MTDSSESDAPIKQLSQALEHAVKRAATSTVLVNARRRMPASGIVWSGDGLVLAAAHTLERDDEITVGLPDDREVPATLVGRDAGSDLAVLRMNGGTAEPVERADSDSAAIGHLVLAVARPAPGGPMASMGVISARGGAWRTRADAAVGGFLRADLTLYPGFSGGPLVDQSGRTLGMNTSHFARGGGFAIPIAAAQPIVEALISHGRVRRAFLGASSQPTQLPNALAAKVGGQRDGLLVTAVEEGSPADGAGLLIGDVLVAMGGNPIRDTDDLLTALAPERIGALTKLTVLRGGDPTELTVQLGARPS